MGKQRRKFETGFKKQIVGEVESGLLSVSAASRKYQISDQCDRSLAATIATRRIGECSLGSRESLGAGEPRAQREAGRALSGGRAFKKLGDWLRRHKSVSTSVITAESLPRLPKGPKS